MPPKKKKDGLGRSLIKDRFAKTNRKSADTYLHTSELNDGYNWGRLNLQSVTEESSFQEFLSIAELAGKEFEAEKLNITFVNPKSKIGLLSKEEHRKYEEKREENKNLLKIPRRPIWNEKMSKEELELMERDDFLQWRRNLSLLQDDKDILLTPYEKNLEFWRQLWRVVERSEVIVQILDARNPLLFRCEDLEKYVKEISINKLNMLLINKSDYLTEEQRVKWAKYFDKVGIKAVFFSAKIAALETLEEEKQDVVSEPSEEKSSRDETSDSEDDLQGIQDGLDVLKFHDKNDKIVDDSTSNDINLCSSDNVILNESGSSTNGGENSGLEVNSPKLLGREELINLFGNFVDKFEELRVGNTVTIGMVGYPNVGKSSTINALLAKKKVSVSATPGKTKHFQTIFLRDDILLCDCPGLVMPSFISTKAEMVLNGILPIDQMRDHVAPTSLLTTLIPRDFIESEYSIMIPRPREGEDPNRTPTYEELLNAYAYSRGFMTQNGQPDNPRAARYILKDFVNGRLLYCIAPPGEPQEEFHKFTIKKTRKPVQMTAQAERAVRVTHISADKVINAHFKNIQNVPQKDSQNMDSSNDKSKYAAKPWKNHKEKRNKKEKLRRVYRELDI